MCRFSLDWKLGAGGNEVGYSSLRKEGTSKNARLSY